MNQDSLEVLAVVPSPARVRDRHGIQDLDLAVVADHDQEALLDLEEEIFGVYGEITELDYPWDRVLCTYTEVATITYGNESSAKEAILRMNGGQLDGQAVTAAYWKDPRSTNSTRYIRPRSPIRPPPRSYRTTGWKASRYSGPNKRWRSPIRRSRSRDRGGRRHRSRS
eukprot:Ihof_evm2s602 gene=Ihof_evmTU2s602